MSVEEPVTAGATPKRHLLRWVVIGVGAAVAVAVAGPVGVLIYHQLNARDVPKFPSLTSNPDTSLQGTIAYTHFNIAENSACVRIVAAAGQPSKQVYCIPQDQALMPQKDSKLIGPQLVWLPDGRLQVTMFRMAVGKGQPPNYSKGWQRVVNVRTGAVAQTPDADLPSTWNLDTRPRANPTGQQLTFSSSSSGKIKITLTEPTGSSRTLLSAQGPGESTYRLNDVFWAPNWQWIAASDGRILIITPGDPAVTRVLTDQSADLGFGGEGVSNFAITSANLLTTPG